MTLHFQDEVAVNLLTIDATDPKSGTAEFKATAIRIEKPAVEVGARFPSGLDALVAGRRRVREQVDDPDPAPDQDRAEERDLEADRDPDQ